MNSRVFICHSSADADDANLICAQLESNGIECWIAPRDPIPGLPWGQQLVRAIVQARVVLLVLSPKADASRHVLSEIQLAMSRNKVILPVQIADVRLSDRLEFYISAIHWFNATARSAEVWTKLASRVRQLVSEPGEELLAGAPGASPAARPPSNLPQQLSSFVGREREVAEISSLLVAHPLVTLLGSGGAGKTRTALEVAANVLQRHKDGVWLVELGRISEAPLVSATISLALDASQAPNASPLDALVDHLKHAQLLLILDNCEHVIGEVRAVAAAIVRRCPNVRILATSRESLGIRDERVVRLPPLTLPARGGDPSAQTALGFGAVQLFVDRALAADGQFALTNADTPSVVEICRRLDGIPFAIELAAARIKVLSPAQLAKRLDERFRVLTGGDRDALPSHRTLRALIDWSYDLLADPERATFRRVSVFANAFSLEAAVAACGGDDEIDVLDRLASLADKSLLQAEPGAEVHYRLLESTREYARERLAESGDAGACRDRHLAYVRELFTGAASESGDTISGAPPGHIAAFMEDARNAIDWAISRNAPADASDLFLVSSQWHVSSMGGEEIERAKRVLEVVDEGDAPRLARLWCRVAMLAGRTAHYAEAREPVEHAVRYARRSNDSAILADCLLRFADIANRLRLFDEALAALDEAETFSADSPRRKLWALHLRGVIGLLQGDLDTAAHCTAQSHALFASLGDDAGTVSAASNLAEIEHGRGDTRRAIDIATNELPRAERLSDRADWAFLKMNLAGYLCAAGETDAALAAATEAIKFFADRDPRGGQTAIALEHYALCRALREEAETAALLEGYAEKALRDLGLVREHTERVSHERLSALLAERLDPDALAAHLARGERLDVSEALRYVAVAPA